MPRWPFSVRARLTTWYTAVLAVPLVVFAVLSYVALGRTLLNRTDLFLGEALSAFAQELTAEGLEMPTAPLAVSAALGEMQFQELQIIVLDSLSRFVAAGDRPRSAHASAAAHRSGAPIDLRALSDSLVARAGASAPRFTIGDGESSYRVHAMSASVRGVSYRLVDAYPLASLDETLAEFRDLYLIAIPFLLLCAAVGGYLLAQRSLSPVAAMQARAMEISATNLHERLPVTSPHDELGGLATVVNGLLARLEDAFVHQRRFMADASHELRTPVAILRTELEVTLARPHREEHEYREALTVMGDAAQRLTRIVDDLFLLTRADSGHLTVRIEPLYLEEVVHSAARAVRGLAEQRGVRLVVTSVVGAPYQGDADLLGRLLLNLIDNAIKYSGRDGVVELGLTERNGAFEITVTDDGPGIPPEARERIFDRFYRVDPARSRANVSATGGAGLGLSIARWVTEAHAGRIELVASRPGRTEFRVSLPQRAAPLSAAGARA